MSLTLSSLILVPLILIGTFDFQNSLFSFFPEHNIHCGPRVKIHTFEGCWTHNGGTLHYVSIGPSGMWGVNINNDWNHWFGSYYNLTEGKEPIQCCCFFTPPRNRGGVIFLLQFVCLSVCVWVCVFVCVSVNKIPAERMHWFGRGFR